MSLIIKGRIQYSMDDGSPVIDLTDYSDRMSNLSWKDEAAFVGWVQKKVEEKKDEVEKIIV